MRLMISSKEKIDITEIMLENVREENGELFVEAVDANGVEFKFKESKEEILKLSGLEYANFRENTEDGTELVCKFKISIGYDDEMWVSADDLTVTEEDIQKYLSNIKIIDYTPNYEVEFYISSCIGIFKDTLSKLESSDVMQKTYLEHKIKEGRELIDNLNR